MDENMLLKQLGKGDHRAFSDIFEIYWECLFLHVVRVARDRTASEDIVQETFAALWAQREKLGKVKSLKAYLYSIAHYKAIKYIRQNIHQRDYLASLCLFLEESPLHHTEEQYLATELLAFIEKEVWKLPPRMREVFVLSRFENLSQKEIAEKMGISDNTVKKQINYSLKVLRLKIDDQYLSGLLLLYLLR